MTVRQVRVRLGDRSYDIVIGENIRCELPDHLDFLPKGAQVAVTTSPELRRLYGDDLAKRLCSAGFDAWIADMPDGEAFKTLETASRLYDQFVDRRMERRSLVVALGGGVVGDVAGFVSATYMRGTAFIQVPTTLIAQVDASVGGKVAVDHPKGKNLIGAFHQPRLVFIDVGTLATLPDRQLRAGVAEILRYGVIASPAIFEALQAHMDLLLRRDGEFVAQLVADCCAIKARIVEEDELEGGVRATLNYGHTFGHAIEAVTGYERFLHGEAVGIGMVCAGELARSRGMVDDDFCQRQRGILDSAGLPTECPSDLDTSQVVDAMRLDKKVRAGRVRFIVPTGVGSVQIHDDCSDDEIRRAIEATR